MISRISLLSMFLAAFIVTPALAQPTQDGLESAVEIEVENKAVPLFDEPTHPPVKLSPDKSKLLRLEQVVAKVIVGNPAHLAVLPSDQNTIVLVGRAPGATAFTALDGKGNIIMQRHVLVAPPQNDYVRIRRTCAASEQENCQATQVFYCPDTCHNVAINDGEAEDEASDTMEGDGTSGAQSLPTVPPDIVDSASE